MGTEDIKEDKVINDFTRILNFLDNSYIKKLSGDIALEIMKNGCYYGYVVPSNKELIIQ